MAYWLFQGNPKYYRILDALGDREELPWLVTRYAQEIQIGDGVLVWMAGADAGIYAIAEVVKAPEIYPELPDPEYWLMPKNAKLDKPRAQLKFTRKLLWQPLRRNELKQDQILRELLVIRAPNSTNFKVTTQQWQRVCALKG
ncbi:MAG: EVE domain-containing protein [Synechocystis sp.]